MFTWSFSWKYFFRLSFHLMHRWSVLWSLSCARSPLENRRMKFCERISRQDWQSGWSYTSSGSAEQHWKMSFQSPPAASVFADLEKSLEKICSSWFSFEKNILILVFFWKNMLILVFFEKPDSKPCLIDWPPMGAGDLLAAMWTTMTGGWTCLGQSYTLGDISCSILPFGMEGNGGFERKFEEIWEEIILNEIRMRGRATANVTHINVWPTYNREWGWCILDICHNHHNRWLCKEFSQV